jgi:hypothetical protein
MINLLGQLHQVLIVKEKARKNCGPKKIKHVMDRLKGGQYTNQVAPLDHLDFVIITIEALKKTHGR